MEKAEAIRLLGGTAVSAAEKIGITAQAVSDWPDVLPPRISDRVQAALYRQMRESDRPASGTGKAAAVLASAENGVG